MNWHLITGEYPPQPGGVSDYTFLLARELAAIEPSVTVWCPPADGLTPDDERIAVRRELGAISRSDLHRVGTLLDAEPRPRRLLVQWVPHAFGRRALNHSFCRWLKQRATRHGDRVELIVHEAFLGFEGSWKQRLAALIQRFMVRTVLEAASQVWVTTPAWADLLRPYAPPQLPIEWLPVPSTIPTCTDSDDNDRARHRGKSKFLIGHFGTYGPHVASQLHEVIVRIVEAIPEANFLLLGRGGQKFRETLCKARPDFAARLVAPGELAPAELSANLLACDLFVQPYAGGVSSRNSTLMACLAHGRCVVATSGRLTEALWAETGAIALAPAGDTGAICAAVVRLRNDANARAAMAAAAAKLYLDRFHIRHLIQKLTAGQIAAGGLIQNFETESSESLGVPINAHSHPDQIPAESRRR